jgi:CubicO group peptidase (beta-lactamase class C family)
MTAQVNGRFRSSLLRLLVPLGLLVWIGLSLIAVGAFQPTAAIAATAPDITAANWYWGPGNRWAYKNTRRIFPTAEIPKGNGPVANLEYAVLDIDEITFTHPTTGAPMTIREMYTATDTDAFLVLRDGKIITERYFNGMKPEDQHLLMSVSKSVLGALAGIIVEQGRLDPQALITHYIPELKGSVYEGATVRNLLDMSVGLDFDENYSSKKSDLYRLDEAAGWVARGPSADGGLHKYLSMLTKRLGSHGDAFRYASPNADAMAWVLERATNTDFAELLSKELWSKLGAERDAFVLLDGFQAAYADPGVNTTLRDLGRFSQMMLQNGLYNGQRIVPEEWIQDIRHAGDAQAWKNSPAYAPLSKRVGYRNGSYRSFWYVADPRMGRYTAIGLAGQLIVIDPASSTVVVKFSSHSTPGSDKPEVEYAGAAAIVDALSAERGPGVKRDAR